VAQAKERLRAVVEGGGSAWGTSSSGAPVRAAREAARTHPWTALGAACLAGLVVGASPRARDATVALVARILLE
jgi:ElaB/YqjD/DUF883 family membrane-anchored ribosome-binding protein